MGLTLALPAADRVHAARRTAAAEAVAGGDALGAVCLARPAAADGLLPAALRRRYRQPGGRQLGRGRPGLRAARDHARRPADGRRLWRGDVRLRSAAGGGRRGGGRAQHGRHRGGAAGPGRREHQGQALRRPARRVDDARRPDHRDDQGGGVGARGPGPSDGQPGAVDQRLAARHHGRRPAGRAAAASCRWSRRRPCWAWAAAT